MNIPFIILPRKWKVSIFFFFFLNLKYIEQQGYKGGFVCGIQADGLLRTIGDKGGKNQGFSGEEALRQGKHLHRSKD